MKPTMVLTAWLAAAVVLAGCATTDRDVTGIGQQPSPPASAEAPTPGEVAHTTGVPQGCPHSVDTATVVDYVPSVKVNDRMYVREPVEPDEEPLDDADLGDPVAQTRCKLSGVVADPDYRPQNGDAAFLEPGTTLRAVEGFDPGFRLAAQVDGEARLYEADTVPGAQHGADVLGDLAGKVTAINVNSQQDGETVLGRITDQGRVQRLIDMVLDAPVTQARPTGTEERYFVEFTLEDAPPVTRVLFVTDDLLHRGIQVPEEFTAAIRGAASNS